MCGHTHVRLDCTQHPAFTSSLAVRCSLASNIRCASSQLTHDDPTPVGTIQSMSECCMSRTLVYSRVRMAPAWYASTARMLAAAVTKEKQDQTHVRGMPGASALPDGRPVANLYAHNMRCGRVNRAGRMAERGCVGQVMSKACSSSGPTCGQVVLAGDEGSRAAAKADNCTSEQVRACCTSERQ